MDLEETASDAVDMRNEDLEEVCNILYHFLSPH